MKTDVKMTSCVGGCGVGTNCSPRHISTIALYIATISYTFSSDDFHYQIYLRGQAWDSYFEMPSEISKERNKINCIHVLKQGNK